MRFFNTNDKKKGHPFTEFVEATFKKDNNEVPPIVGFALGNTVALMINSPDLAEDLFLTKNKYFDKFPKAARLFSRLTGDSILFANSDLKW